MLYKQQKIKTK